MVLLKKIRLKSGRTLLRRRSVSVKRYNNKFNFQKALRIGILWDATNESSFDAISAFNKKMSGLGKRVEVLAWIAGKEVSDKLTGLSYMRFLRTKDLNFRYIPVSNDAYMFTESNFDLLIDINPGKVFPLTYIATLSKAPMKVGFDNYLNPGDLPYDLMIQTGKSPNIGEFFDQAEHYLSLINA